MSAGDLITKGSRWEDRDRREFGRDGEPRVVEVICADGDPVDPIPPHWFVMVRVVEAPNKPYTICRESRLRGHTLLSRYRLIVADREDTR